MFMDAVVLLSGGQDSTTSLFWALSKYNSVFALIIDYGQKHRIEIESAKQIATMAGVEYKVLDLNFFKEIGNSALLDKETDVSKAHDGNENLPASFVPGRNLIFVTVASMLAFKLGATSVVTGVCQTDYSGYPDCRDLTMRSLNETIVKGMEFNVLVETPLMWLDKAETVELAVYLPGCMEALAYSHTCYNGEYPPCTRCPSCTLRAKGFQEADERDPLIVRYYEK
ncbi:MAG: 7-cyano-7-deazaguanine synthase QueC [Deltaproteobacteria bacterium]|nr:7-cyano-7-deazaguanine synthase QueC [Deltaproteobacteria bacterium]